MEKTEQTYEKLNVPDEIVNELYIESLRVVGNKMLDPQYIKTLELNDDQLIIYLKGVGDYLIDLWFNNYKKEIINS